MYNNSFSNFRKALRQSPVVTGRKESPFPHSHHALSGHSPGFVCVSGASVAIVAQARERSPIAPPFEPEKSTPRTKRFGRDFTNINSGSMYPGIPVYLSFDGRGPQKEKEEEEKEGATGKRCGSRNYPCDVEPASCRPPSYHRRCGLVRRAAIGSDAVPFRPRGPGIRRARESARRRPRVARRSTSLASSDRAHGRPPLCVLRRARRVRARGQARRRGAPHARADPEDGRVSRPMVQRAPVSQISLERRGNNGLVFSFIRLCGKSPSQTLRSHQRQQPGGGRHACSVAAARRGRGAHALGVVD